MTYADWIVPGFIGFAFAVLGLLQLMGLYQRLVTGTDRTFADNPQDAGPNWRSRILRQVLPLLFLAFGLGLLAWAIWKLAS